MPPSTPDKPLGQWREVIKPIVDSLDIAVKLQMPYEYNPKGAAALKYILEEMADKLDLAIEIVERDKK